MLKSIHFPPHGNDLKTYGHKETKKSVHKTVPANETSLLVAHHAYFPGRMAHTRQIVVMLEAISTLYDSIICLLPRSAAQNSDFNLERHLAETCDAKTKVQERNIAVLPFRSEHRSGWGKVYDYVALRLNSIIFTIGVLLSKELRQADRIYTRHLLLAYLLTYLPSVVPKLITEIHDLPKSPWGGLKLRRLLSMKVRVGVISQGLATQLTHLFPRLRAKLVMVPDAISERFTSCMEEKQVARRQLKISHENQIVTYCGSLYDFCAPDTLLEAFKYVCGAKVSGWIIGSITPPLTRLMAEMNPPPNVKFWGWQSHDNIPLFLSASDVLVVSYAGWHWRAAQLSSPIKIFEYIAAGKPIVAPALPSVEEILRDGETALLYRAGDAEHMSACIRRLIDDPELGERLAARASKKVDGWTWCSRAKRLFL